MQFWQNKDNKIKTKRKKTTKKEKKSKKDKKKADSFNFRFTLFFLTVNTMLFVFEMKVTYLYYLSEYFFQC